MRSLWNGSNAEELRFDCPRTWCTEICQLTLLCPSVWKRVFPRTSPPLHTLPTCPRCTRQQPQLSWAQETLRCRLSDWGSAGLRLRYLVFARQVSPQLQFHLGWFSPLAPGQSLYLLMGCYLLFLKGCQPTNLHQILTVFLDGLLPARGSWIEIISNKNDSSFKFHTPPSASQCSESISNQNG